MNPAVTPAMTADLSGLRGPHWPVGGGGLQSAVATAIALGFAAALLVGLVRWLRARGRASLRREALRELDRARGLDPEARRVALARLLRRLVLSLEPRAAALSGPAWGRALDRVFSTDFFSAGAGRTLTEGLYRRPDGHDADAVAAELGRLLKRVGA